MTDESLKRRATYAHGFGRVGDIAVMEGERAGQVLPREITHGFPSHVLKTHFSMKGIGRIIRARIFPCSGR